MTQQGSERTIDLPSGKVAAIRKAYGRDLVQAARMAGGGDGIKLTFGIIATVTRIDGAPIVIEDVEALELMDVMTLMGAVVGNAVSLTGSISLPSGSMAGSPTPS